MEVKELNSNKNAKCSRLTVFIVEKNIYRVKLKIEAEQSQR